MSAAFDHVRGEAERKARLRRMEINAAKRDLMAGRFERMCKPGQWRVFRDGDRVVVEDFETSPA